MNRREMILALFVSPLCWLLGIERRVALVGPPIYGKLQWGRYQHPATELVFTDQQGNSRVIVGTRRKLTPRYLYVKGQRIQCGWLAPADPSP